MALLHLIQSLPEIIRNFYKLCYDHKMHDGNMEVSMLNITPKYIKISIINEYNVNTPLFKCFNEVSCSKQFLFTSTILSAILGCNNAHKPPTVLFGL